MLMGRRRVGPRIARSKLKPPLQEPLSVSQSRAFCYVLYGWAILMVFLMASYIQTSCE